jgi:hypothetical protein
MHTISGPWTDEVQKQFIVAAYEFYKKKHGDPRVSATYGYEQYQPRDLVAGHQRRLDTLTFLYQLGRGGGQLRVSYQEFEFMVLHGFHTPACRTHHRQYRWRCGCRNESYEHWYPRNGAHYRCKTPNNVTRKERDLEAEEQKRQKQEWREKKGFQRTKNQDKNWRRGNGRRSYCRKIGNRSLRRWERQMIGREDWSALADEKTILHLFLNPYDWD